MNESVFAQAVNLARSGRKVEARGLLQELLKVDRANEMAWLWYAECLDTPGERIRALEFCARFNPHAQRARQRLQALRRSEGAANDLGRTQPIFIQDVLPPRERKACPSPSPEEEWALSAGSAVFTVPPEEFSNEELRGLIRVPVLHNG
jgi:hypothetical protein